MAQSLLLLESDCLYCRQCLFVLFFFPRGVLDEILNLTESVSEGSPSYFCWEEIRRSHLHESPNPMGPLEMVITQHHWVEVFLEEVNGQDGRTL